MQSTYSDKIDHAFVLNESDLRNAWRKLETYGCSVTAIVQFSDKVEREVETIEDLIGFENSKKKSILSIELKSRSDDRNSITSIEFDSSEYRTITVNATGNDELVTRISDEFSEFICGLKPWYSSISRLDVFWLVYVPGFLALMITDMMHASNSEGVALTFKQSATAIAILALIGSALYFSHKLLNKWKNYLFPIASFAIGQGVKRYETQDKFRFTVVIGFFVSIAASIFLGLFS
ncbi:hypothetical protein [Shewanella holmiensis]|uniref:Uncharacterized protein n=1 Tax=Shewanella holmiensis TaxID=2952222 RepID=A0A9X2WLM7_9GAMM|nr:hypothetical protein [Shewanella holmiensis]MCT7941550.1 hypothetical protein [Shewanella holmiensis]